MLSRWRIVLSGLLAVGTVHAHGGAAERYPWDLRPASCFQSPPSRDAACAIDQWPTWNETQNRIQYLYSTEQYAALERALKETSEAQKTFENGDSPAAAAYWTFRRLVPAPSDTTDHEVQIAKWTAAVPNSVFVTFLRARVAYANAWNTRGTGLAGSVSPESWALYYLRLREAENLLLDAPEALRRTPLWHNLLLAVVLDNPKSVTKPDAALNEAAKRWPRYYELYSLRLTRLVPKWGGSWEGVESFIDTWSRKLAASEGNSLYARLYIGVHHKGGVAPGETAMNWPRMKASLEDLTRRYPAAEFKNLRASYACAARDKDAFSRAMTQLPQREVDQQNWLSGYSFDACMRWAVI